MSIDRTDFWPEFMFYTHREYKTAEGTVNIEKASDDDLRRGCADVTRALAEWFEGVAPPIDESMTYIRYAREGIGYWTWIIDEIERRQKTGERVAPPSYVDLESHNKNPRAIEDWPPVEKRVL